MNSKNRVDFLERREEASLKNSIFGESWLEEVKEIDKHEILVKICNMLDGDPANFGIAEEIFDKLRFEMAKYVIHHEYSKEETVRYRLLIWLDSKTNPENVDKINEFGNLYLK
ncbi:MAG: hypothetical protein LBT84_06060 [Spirochaetia bacterium]|nr:hypothetical protein [Spirochaetia bacterium]